MQKARRHATKALRPLVGVRFQELFHSAARGAFHLSLTVLYSIGHQVVFSLRRWASLLPTEFLVLDGTLDLHSSPLLFRLRGFYALWLRFPTLFVYFRD